MESAKGRGYRAAKNKYAAQLYNLTPETINQLFAVYEN